MDSKLNDDPLKMLTAELAKDLETPEDLSKLTSQKTRYCERAGYRVAAPSVRSCLSDSLDRW
jgi:hypothetical protein